MQNPASSSAGPRIVTSQEDQTDLLLMMVPEAPPPKMCYKQFPKEISGESAETVTKL